MSFESEERIVMSNFNRYQTVSPLEIPVFPGEILVDLFEQPLDAAFEAAYKKVDETPGLYPCKREEVKEGLAYPGRLNFTVTARCTDPNLPLSDLAQAADILLGDIDERKDNDRSKIRALALRLQKQDPGNATATISYYGLSPTGSVIGDIGADMESGEYLVAANGRYGKLEFDGSFDTPLGLTYPDPDYTQRLTRVTKRVIEVFKNAQPEDIEATYVRGLDTIISGY